MKHQSTQRAAQTQGRVVVISFIQYLQKNSKSTRLTPGCFALPCPWAMRHARGMTTTPLGRSMINNGCFFFRSKKVVADSNGDCRGNPSEKGVKPPCKGGEAYIRRAAATTPRSPLWAKWQCRRCLQNTSVRNIAE